MKTYLSLGAIVPRPVIDTVLPASVQAGDVVAVQFCVGSATAWVSWDVNVVPVGSTPVGRTSLTAAPVIGAGAGVVTVTGLGDVWALAIPPLAFGEWLFGVPVIWSLAP